MPKTAGRHRARRAHQKRKTHDQLTKALTLKNDDESSNKTPSSWTSVFNRFYGSFFTAPKVTNTNQSIDFTAIDFDPPRPPVIPDNTYRITGQNINWDKMQRNCDVMDWSTSDPVTKIADTCNGGALYASVGSSTFIDERLQCVIDVAQEPCSSHSTSNHLNGLSALSLLALPFIWYCVCKKNNDPTRQAAIQAELEPYLAIIPLVQIVMEYEGCKTPSNNTPVVTEPVDDAESQTNYQRLN